MTMQWCTSASMSAILLLSLLGLARRGWYFTSMAPSVSVTFASRGRRMCSNSLLGITKCILERIIVKSENAICIAHVFLVPAIFVATEITTQIAARNRIFTKFLIHEIVRRMLLLYI